MSSASPSFDDRFVDLLIQRSTTGLSESERREFEHLSHSPKHESEVERYDLTAAALDLAFGSRDRESMPRDIQDRLLMTAGSFFRNGSKGASTATSADAKLELSQRRAASRFQLARSSSCGRYCRLRDVDAQRTKSVCNSTWPGNRIRKRTKNITAKKRKPW